MGLRTSESDTAVIMRIVFAAVGDPVGAGVVQSLARPGGNATGPSLQQTDTVGKRLGLFRELTPVCAVWRSWPIAQMRPPSWRCAMLRRRPALSASSRSHRKFIAARISCPHSTRSEGAWTRFTYRVLRQKGSELTGVK